MMQPIARCPRCSPDCGGCPDEETDPDPEWDEMEPVSEDERFEES